LREVETSKFRGSKRLDVKGREMSSSVYRISAREDRPGHLQPLSPWTRSRAKRCFDVALVLAALPIVAPVCLLIALAIRISSPGPVFFLQRRVGRHGTPFSIVKFRSMRHRAPANRGSITTINYGQITPVGRVLRAWKLDELPQLLNVLRGDMSLVGPRPRVPDQPAGRLDCRPGITGAASLAYAREEVLLAGIPRHQLDTYYAGRVIPLKKRLDNAYMARATFSSDLRLLLQTIVRVWIAADSSLPAPTGKGKIRQILPGESGD
jgi:lipopolysaccharide/colanic/teichoic acid biosynthesis glycosyltransferase